jgi:hypothetical protein
MNDAKRVRLRREAAEMLWQAAERMPDGPEKASLLTAVVELEAAALDLEAALKARETSPTHGDLGREDRPPLTDN